MRKNAPRKWIHAILDLLPLLVIPIFAIFTRNESNTFENNIELQIEQNKVVDFNQNIINGNFSEGINNFTLAYLTYLPNEQTPTFYKSDLGGCNIGINNFASFLKANDYYLFSIDIGTSYTDNDTTAVIVAQGNGTEEAFNLGIVQNTITTLSTRGRFTRNNFNTLRVTLGWNKYFPADTYFYINKIECFNLTQMFGSGNEPTTQEFYEWYPNSYYDYTLSEKQLLKNVSTQTLNNTDIGSQFLYSVYKPVNEYFNFNNLFNMQGIYDWLQLNLFGGNAPLPVLIVWNIIVYEFFIDLIFLLYSVFMFIIDWSTSMLDKFLYRSRS